ncbi:MAG: glycosyltransferase family 1 protein [Marinilabiliales bacterium]|nr:MAG: glycosyltransferase family 1 protein [Marinilabiliales bacterium]
MRIAVNTRLLLPGKLEGIGWFACETLKRITRDHPEHDFIFLFDRPWSDEFLFSGNITPVVASPPARHPFLWYTWFEYSIPAVLRRTGAELLISPDGYIPLSTAIPSVAVIHDINFMHRPDFHPWLTRAYYRRYFPRFAERAERIATVSEYSRNDIIKTFGVSPGKVDVVYNGASEDFVPLNGEDKGLVKRDIAGGSDYFLFVGSFHRRKNVSGMLRAYDKFRCNTGTDIKLVLAGERMYDYPEMEKTISGMKFADDLVFTGYLDQLELRRVYGAAVALVYIPFFEGFGIPLLEAMSCDTPVIASNRTSVPEVVGNAAHIVDPDDPVGVAEAMARLAKDPEYRKVLVERGRERRNFFSWDQTSRLLWDCIEKVISHI